MNPKLIKYDFSNILFQDKKAGLYLFGFSNTEQQFALAVAGWTERREHFRFQNLVSIDAPTYAHIAGQLRRDFDFNYRGNKTRFVSVRQLAIYLNANKL